MNLKELVSQKRRGKGLWWERALSLVEGCTPVSEACEHCWSAAQCHMRQHQKNSRAWARYGGLTTSDGKWNGKVRLLRDNLHLPEKVQKPTLWAVWNDLFHPEVPQSFRNEAIYVMQRARQHFFLILTKRPENLAWNFEENLPNVGLGVTVELPRYLSRIELLLDIPAALHFVSLEPLLDDIDLRQFKTKLKWLIIGCESGIYRREMKRTWMLHAINDCSGHMPIFLKQVSQFGKVVHAPEPSLLQFPEVEWQP